MEKFIELRKKLHKYPELSLKEFNTKKTIIDFVKSLENSDLIQVHEVSETGFFIDISGQAKETTSKNIRIAFRADIDALPIQEESDLTYKSVVPNVMHACGHDGHVATQCAFMEFIFRQIINISSNFSFRFIFQPAEELLKGAKIMIDGGCLDGVDEIYGFHVSNSAEIGTIMVNDGPVLSGPLEINITINGKGGHSSDPSSCNSPITTAADIIRKLEQMPSQDISNNYPFVLTVGKVETSSMKFNIIPDTAKILASARILDPSQLSNIKNKILSICDNIAKINNSRVEVKLKSMNPIVNDSKIAKDVVLPALSRTKYRIDKNILPIMASDDFALYTEKVPGFFLIICGYDSGHTEKVQHRPLFNFNDLIIPIGVECYARIVEERLGIKLKN